MQKYFKTRHQIIDYFVVWILLFAIHVLLVLHTSIQSLHISNKTFTNHKKNQNGLFILACFAIMSKLQKRTFGDNQKVNLGQICFSEIHFIFGVGNFLTQSQFLPELLFPQHHEFSKNTFANETPVLRI